MKNLIPIFTMLLIIISCNKKQATTNEALSMPIPNSIELYTDKYPNDGDTLWVDSNTIIYTTSVYKTIKKDFGINIKDTSIGDKYILQVSSNALFTDTTTLYPQDPAASLLMTSSTTGIKTGLTNLYLDITIGNDYQYNWNKFYWRWHDVKPDYYSDIHYFYIYNR